MLQSGQKSLLPTVELNETEAALCTLINNACRWIESTHPQPDAEESGGVQIDYHNGWTLEARIAGGWVRDKLLGFQSHDLDVSLSSLTGHIFALLLRNYLLSQAFSMSELANTPGSPFNRSAASSSEGLVGHITRIAANPEQSKNLETATAKVAGLQLDFVNLRKEVYVGDSRIPTMTFGTAKEDAERRDITINTLFFNVHTRMVEDLTGLGLADMRDRIVRTPLAPTTTFLDDPLRVLRCVRFASRFGYNIHPDIVQCFDGKEGEEILRSLRNKVSRERFGIEIDKMMQGPSPLRGISLINDFNLFDTIFQPPTANSLRGKPTSHAIALRAASLVNLLWDEARRRKEGSKASANLDQLPDMLLQPLLDSESRRVLFYLSTLLPLKDVLWEEKKGKWCWAGECVIANGLKLPTSIRRPVADLMKATETLHRPYSEVFDASRPEYRGHLIPDQPDCALTPRATMALLVRQSCITNVAYGLHVVLCLLWTAIQDVAEQGGELQPTLARTLPPYLDFLTTLHSFGLIERATEEKLLTGAEIQEVLKIGPSPIIKKIIAHVEAWQLDRNITNREEARDACKQWLAQEWAMGGIVPINERLSVQPKKKLKGA